MGVHGLWKLIEPSGRVIPLESMADKILAVDVSIWLHQAMKGMHDARGAPIAVAHLLILFHRLCKLLFYKIRPVFVFDGGVPMLKRQTMAVRRQQSNAAKTEAMKVRGKLLKNLLKHEAVRQVLANEEATAALGLSSFTLPGPAIEEDLYKLPPIAAESVNSNSSEEEEEVEEDDVKHFQDIHSIDVRSQEFLSLPPEVRHDILTEMIDTRKQSSWKNLDKMPKESDDFSDYQMNRLLKRHAVQVSLEQAGKEMGGKALSLQELEELLGDTGVIKDDEGILPSRRIAQDSVTRYMLVKKSDDVKKPGTGVQDEKVKSEEVKKEFDIVEHLQDVEWSSDSDGEVLELKYRNDINNVPSKDVEEILAVLEDEKEKEEREKAEIMVIESEKSEKKTKTYLEVDLEEELNEKQANIGKTVAEIHVTPTALPTLSENDSPEERKDVLPTKNDEFVRDASKTVLPTAEKSLALIADATVLPTSSENASLNDNEDDSRTIDSCSSLEARNSALPIVGKAAKLTVLSTLDQNLAQKTTKDVLSTIDELSSAKETVLPIEDKAVTPVVDENVLSSIDKLPGSSETVLPIVDKAVTSIVDETVLPIEGKIAPCDVTERVDDEKSTSSDSESDFVAIGDSNDEILVSEEVETKRLEVVIDPTKIDKTEDLFADVFSEVPKVSEEEKIVISPPISANEEIAKLDEEIAALSKDLEEESEEVEEEEKEEVEKVKEVRKPMTEAELKNLQKELEDEQDELVAEQGKQERHAQSVTEQMCLDAQELLRLFGVPYIVAPMEAEAQCAVLDMLGLTQGTITDDSDIWLFGGRVVYKNFFNQKKHVLEYRSEDIQKYFKLSREEMIKLAMLVGSDYTPGLNGIGPVTALEILAAFPCPNQGGLLTGLQRFRDWVTSGFMTGPSRAAALKKKIKNADLSPGFPSTAVVEAYLHPAVDDSDEPFSWAKPNLKLIQNYTKLKFGWSNEKCNELLMPVMKKLMENTNQTTIEKFFRVAAKPSLTEGVLSKRVENAVKRLGRTDSSPEEDADDPEPKPKKKRRVTKPKSDLEKPSTSFEKSKAKAIKQKLHAKEKIPQKEATQKILEDRKRKAAEIFNKGKKGAKKKKTVVRDEVNLSESSSDE